MQLNTNTVNSFAICIICNAGLRPLQVWGGRREGQQLPVALLVPHHAHRRQEHHSVEQAQRHPQALLLLRQDDGHREGEAGDDGWVHYVVRSSL